METQDTSVTRRTDAHEQPSTRSNAADLRRQLLKTLPVSERWLTLNGMHTAILEGGSGAPIVLLHGPGAYGAQWVRAIPELVSTHRVIAPDLPGHGASAALEGTPDTDRICGWLDDLIECTCPIPPVLVGHTLGGAIAAAFAGKQSERLAVLVLVDALGLSAFQPAPEFGAALNEFLSGPTARTHDRLWSQCVFDLPAVKERLGELWELIRACNLAGMQGPDALAALSALMDLFGIPALPPATLTRIAVPTTLIWGRHDRATPLSVAEAASARYGWPLHVIEEAADDPALEQPEMFLDTLRRILERRGAAS